MYVGVVFLMELLKHDVLKDAIFFEIKRGGPNVSRSTCICPLVTFQQTFIIYDHAMYYVEHKDK